MKKIFATIILAIATILSTNAQDFKIVDFEPYSYNEHQDITVPAGSIIWKDVCNELKPGCIFQIKYYPAYTGDITCTVTFITPAGEKAELFTDTSRILTLVKFKCTENNQEYYNYRLYDRYDNPLFDLYLMDNGYAFINVEDYKRQRANN